MRTIRVLLIGGDARECELYARLLAIGTMSVRITPIYADTMRPSRRPDCIVMAPSADSRLVKACTHWDCPLMWIGSPPETFASHPALHRIARAEAERGANLITRIEHLCTTPQRKGETTSQPLKTRLAFVFKNMRSREIEPKPRAASVQSGESRVHA